MGRKRPRSRAALTDDDDQLVDAIDESPSAQDHDGRKSQQTQQDEPPEEEESKKELEVWDAFKEEHHEGSLSNAPSTRLHALIFSRVSS